MCTHGAPPPGASRHFKLKARGEMEIGNKITNWDKCSINHANRATAPSGPGNESRTRSEPFPEVGGVNAALPLTLKTVNQPSAQPDFPNGVLG